MFKKTSLIFSLLIMLSMVLSACNAKSGVPETSVTPGSFGNETPLSSQDMTAVATVVSGVNQSQTASAGTQSPLYGTPGFTNTITSTYGMSGTAEATPGFSGGTAMPATTQMLTTQSLPAGYSMDWFPIWNDFITNIPTGAYTYSPDELQRRIGSTNPPFLLDVRDASEVTQFGYIKGAINIQWRDVLPNLAMLPAQDKEIVVYSGNEYRETAVMAALRMLGYTNVFVLDGGMSAWQRAQKPSETLVPPTVPTPGNAPDVDQAKLTDLQYFITSNSYGITPQDLAAQLGGAAKPFILDVRQRHEASADGNLEGSTLIPLSTLFANLSMLPADKTSSIVIYDTTGVRATLATMALQMIGYKNARSIYGGFVGWVDAGLPYIK